MPSLIEEIQRDAIDETVPVTTTLRRVKLAAAKLKLESIEDWVSHELNGYPEGSTVPEYRILQGRMHYNNGYTGWQELLGDTVQISRKGNGQSIAEIEAMSLRNINGNSAMIPIGGTVADQLNKACKSTELTFALFIGRDQFSAILSAVRNAVLEWAINLENIGVTGVGMSFSNQEKEKAAAESTTIHIGAITNFAGNIGSRNEIAGSTFSSDDVGKIIGIVKQMRENAVELSRVANDADLFNEKLADLEAEVVKTQPSPSIASALLTDLRNTLSGAAGSLVASGAVTMLNQALGTGVPAS